MSALEAYFPLLSAPPAATASMLLMSGVDLASLAALLLLFQRALKGQGLPPLWRAGFLLLALGQSGFLLALGQSRGLGLLLIATWILGFGLVRLKSGPPEQAYLALALSTPLLALFGVFGLALAAASVPALLYLRRPSDGQGFAAHALLAGFPLCSTLLALSLFAWMTPGKLASLPGPDPPGLTSLSHPWAQLTGGRFVVPLLIFLLLLVIAAPAQLAKPAHALRVLSLSLAGAGALATFFKTLPTPAPVLVVGAAIALLAPLSTGANQRPAKAALGLAAAMCGGWLLVFLGSQQASLGSTSMPTLEGSPNGSLASERHDNAIGEREAIVRTHVARLPP